MLLHYFQTMLTCAGDAISPVALITGACKGTFSVVTLGVCTAVIEAELGTLIDICNNNMH